MSAVFVVAAKRTPIGKFGGGLAGASAADLGVAAVRGLLDSARIDPAIFDEVAFGNGRQAGGGPNVARQISVRSGIPVERSAWTINQACGSGLRALIDGARQIIAGEITAFLAGGTESMSRLPFFLDPSARWGTKLGHRPVVDGMYQDGFMCPLAGELMGETVERLVGQYGIGREEQDSFALLSQQRAARAAADGRFASEIVPVRNAEGRLLLEADEHLRPDTTAQSLARLPAVFSKTGSVTAGNSSGITDGAAAIALMSEEAVSRSGLTPLARVEAWASAGVDPKVMGLGPVPAVRSLLEKTRTRLEDFDLIEINEAFAAQVLACGRELHFDGDRLNVNGGAIALGHPIGCTGARIVVTLLSEMQRRKVKRGLATLCISGGMGLAVSFVDAGA